MRESEHFRVEKLAEGVYAVIATEKGGGFSNAGIIDLGDRTLIFDTFETVQAGEDLRAVAEELTSGPITYVVISHLHPDHWCGNQAFPSQASIISTHHTREMMPELVKDLLSLKANPSDLEDEMLEIQEALEKEGNSLKRSSLESYIARLHQDLSSLPRIEPRLPNQTFDGKLVFSHSFSLS